MSTPVAIRDNKNQFIAALDTHLRNAELLATAAEHILKNEAATINPVAVRVLRSALDEFWLSTYGTTKREVPHE